MGVTRDIVDFVVRARYEDLPPAAIEAAKDALLNVFGCTIAGHRTRIGALHVELAAEMAAGATSGASIIGHGARLAPPLAAYANGNLAFALDYEDTLRYVTHPGFITMACGLAAAEPRRASGRELILAVVLGYEIVARIGPAMQPTPERGRVVWGEQYHLFAGAVTAGKLAGLDADALDAAFGIAGMHAPVPSAYKYFGVAAETTPRREAKLGWGWMCMGAMLAVRAAERGFRGGYGILDGERGFHVMAGSDRVDVERMTRGLGEHWLILDTEHKIFPAIARNSAPYFATKALVDAHRIRAEDVARVVVRGMQMPLVADHDPQTAVDAQFSLPFAVVMALTGDPLGPETFAAERMHRPLVRALLGRIELEHDHAADALFFNEQRLRFSVRIETSDGRRFMRDIEFPREQPRLGRAGIERKFRTLAAPTLAPPAIERAIETTLALDRIDDVGVVVDALCPGR